MPVACAIGATGAPSAQFLQDGHKLGAGQHALREYPNSCGVQICWSRDRPTNQRNTGCREICSCSGSRFPVRTAAAHRTPSSASMRQHGPQRRRMQARLARARTPCPDVWRTAASGWPAEVDAAHVAGQTSCETIRPGRAMRCTDTGCSQAESTTTDRFSFSSRMPMFGLRDTAALSIAQPRPPAWRSATGSAWVGRVSRRKTDMAQAGPAAGP